MHRLVVMILLTVIGIVGIIYFSRKFGWMNSLYMLHKRAYFGYRKKVIGEGWRYERYARDFCDSSIFIYDGESEITQRQLNERNNNYYTLVELLYERDDLVVKYFSEDHFSLKDFQQLNKEFNTSYSCVENDQPLEVKNGAVECFQEIEITKNENISKKKDLVQKVLKQNINQSQLKLLTDAMKKFEIFDGEITEDKIFQFFTCSLKNPLVVSKSKRELLACFLSSLHSPHFKYIHPHWQSICGNKKLLISDNNKPISSSSLSSAVSKNVLSEEEEKKIKSCINKLKSLQE